MAGAISILIGTKKGAFLIDGDRDKGDWTLKGPFCEAWPINHVIADRSTGTIYAGGGNEWFGPAVWKTDDHGETWNHSGDGIAYAEGETPVKSVWSLARRNGRLYAGVEPAGLFQSDDGGITWDHVNGLTDHPSRPHWQPGGGGLILHHIVPNPEDEAEMWVGISTGGVFHTADGGKTWAPRNKGTRIDYAPEEDRYPELGQCVHSLALAAGTTDRLYQQNHFGMYRSDDGAQSWRSIEEGLPSTFGFPAVAHPEDPETLFLIPLNGDSIGRHMPEGRAAVWRTRDGGRTWQDLRQGLPQEHAFLTVLRQAMAADPLSPAGLYFGTTSGAVYASADEGETWSLIAEHLPTICSVEVLARDG